jgi:hypothetical protein
MEVDKQRRKVVPDTSAILQSYLHFLNLLASEIREFRFLFRDHADYGEHAEALLGQLPNMLNESLSQVACFFRGMK